MTDNNSLVEGGSPPSLLSTLISLPMPSKIIITLLLFSCHMVAISQGGARVVPVFGVRLHDDSLPTGLRLARPPMMLHSPMAGLELRLFKGWFVGLQKDWHLNPEYIASPGQTYSISEMSDETSLYVLYRPAKGLNSFCFGGYSLHRESILIYSIGRELSITNYKGIFISASRRFQWLDVELRARANLYPDFAALVGLESYALVFSHRLDGTKWSDRGKDKGTRFLLNLTAGVRLLPTQGMQALPNERFAAVGVAPSVGMELLHKNSGLSLNVDKDVWASFNGGSYDRDLKGHIATTSIGIRHHVDLGGRTFRYGLGYAMVRDMARRPTPNLSTRPKLENFQMRGLSVSASYALSGGLDVEARHIIPLYSFDEPLFNPSRFSLGLIYRINNI